MFGKIKLRKADTLFSRYLRLQHKKCEKCGRRGEGIDGIDKLQNSHFHGRRNESTRYDLENCDCLCFSCHQHFEESPHEYQTWKLKKLGKKRYDLLLLRANTYCKRDDALNALLWKQELAKLSTN